MQKSKEGQQKRHTMINHQEGHQSKVKGFVKNEGSRIQQAVYINKEPFLHSHHQKGHQEPYQYDYKAR